MLEAVLFDVDGTLVDSNEQHVDAWAIAFREEGHPQDRDAIRGQVGKGGDMLVPALLPNATDEVRKRISDRHGDVFKSRYLDAVEAFPCATELIERAHRAGLKVVLASSAKQDEIDHYVGLLGIANCLAATTSIDDADASKPAPDIFGAALEKIGVDADRALVVGDSIYDVEAASKAGVAAIGLTSGPFDQKQLEDAGAIAVFADAASLLRNYDRSPLAR